MKARCGHEPASGLYYEVLGRRDRIARPLLFIPGGGATGSCFRATPDGRAGWADLLADRGYECWVTDWPGTGRSGGRTVLEIEYSDVVDGYRRLLRDVIGEAAVIVCHSMGGAVSWQLVEHESALVDSVVSVAGAYPANTPPHSDPLRDDGRTIEVVFGDTGVRFVVDRERPYLYEDAYIYEQAIAGSTHFPMDAVEQMRSGLVGLPPRMLLQRLGVIPGMPVVERTAGFAGKHIRLIAGDEDPAHTREIEQRTIETLRSWGADAALVWLPDLGLHGHGHYVFFEHGSDEVLEILVQQIHDVAEMST